MTEAVALTWVRQPLLGLRHAVRGAVEVGSPTLCGEPLRAGFRVFAARAEGASECAACVTVLARERRAARAVEEPPPPSP